MRNIQLLKLLHPADLRSRQRPLQTVITDVKHRQLLQHPDLRRQASRQIIIHQDQLIQSLSHFPNAAGDTAAEIVIRQDEHRNRRIPKILRDPKLEPVIIQKQGIQIFIEHLIGDAAFEFVKPEVQEFQGGQIQDHLREPTDEPVVTEIQLEKQLQFPEGVGNHAAEPVGIHVEQCQVSEEP